MAVFPVFWLGSFAMLLPLLLFGAEAPDQEELKQRLQQLAEDISALQSELEQSRDLHRREQVSLKELDLEIQQTALRLRQLDEVEGVHRERLAGLSRQRDEQVAALNERKVQLANLIAATYRLGKESRIKLLLNQDSPSRLGRLLGYFDRINRSQALRIVELESALTELDRTVASIDRELNRIAVVQTEQHQAQKVRESQRKERETLLARLVADIADQQRSLEELHDNHNDLEQLLEKLSNALADIPADLGSHIGVAEQRGRLPMPVAGRLLYGFGQRRAAGLHWQGWLLEAAPTTEVQNIAYGRVAFADWLRGYGLLMIIDHGQGFLTLYGYNESLLWEVGDWVDPGAVIATVGSTPAGEQGLYFELRKDGRALDPAGWLKR